MISNRVIDFCLGAVVGAGLVFVIRVIFTIVGLVAMNVPR